MKLQHLVSGNRQEGRTLATFGEARLVKKLDGKYELQGGSAENRTEAKEWISLFLHEAVITFASDTTVPANIRSRLCRPANVLI